MVDRKREPQVNKNIDRRFKRILAAVDGSEHSERASDVSVDLADRFGAELIVLHMIPRVSRAFVPFKTTLLFREYYSEERQAAEKWIGRVISLAKSRGVSVRSDVQVAVPSVAEEIVRYARKNSIDLIVIGTRGLGAFEKLLIGSVSSGVLSHAHCPVLAVR